MATERNDIHRPSEIDPTEYEFVALDSRPKEYLDYADIGYQREILRRHMKKTGGLFSMHEHKGSCHICGAHAIDLAIYYHPKTNTYIKTGLDCAEKMLDGDPDAFQRWRKQRRSEEKTIAGKKKAEKTLMDAGLHSAWDIYRNLDEYVQGGREFSIIYELVHKLINYGHLTDKQWSLLNRLVNQIGDPDKRVEDKQKEEERKQAEYDSAENAPEGKTTITGDVLGTRVDHTDYGLQFKMLVKDDRGFKVWSTIPSAIMNEFDMESIKGHKITFVATLIPSKDDPKFAIAKRPSKAKVATPLD